MHRNRSGWIWLYRWLLSSSLLLDVAIFVRELSSTEYIHDRENGIKWQSNVMNSLGNVVYKIGIEWMEQKKMNRNPNNKINHCDKWVTGDTFLPIALAIAVIEWAAILLCNLYDILQAHIHSAMYWYGHKNRQSTP